jgi:hypothetical protein
VTARYVGARSLRLVEETRDAHYSRSRLRCAACVLATTAALTALLAAPAAATTETFNFTGAAQTWTVPAGVIEATFDLHGASGGGFAPGATRFLAGLGGRATATIPVAPGDSIQVNVGGQGARPTGGFNGGGTGTGGGAGSPGAGGGGASDIRIDGTDLDDRVLVAGGGGGAGNVACGLAPPFGASSGGGGGGELGAAGTTSNCAGAAAGGGGTQSTGGSATSPATQGSSGLGGNAAGDQAGGGGGGWFGGGGGLIGAGGGGGSGHGPAGTVFETGVRSGNGLVTVTYTVVTIADVIDSVEALDLPRGLENSLLKKLTNAQRNADADKLNGACGKLGAFIHQVKAQSGKKIAAGDADDLITEAGALRESLGCRGAKGKPIAAPSPARGRPSPHGQSRGNGSGA